MPRLNTEKPGFLNGVVAATAATALQSSVLFRSKGRARISCAHFFDNFKEAYT
jgi:hypothetical protein